MKKLLVIAVILIFNSGNAQTRMMFELDTPPAAPGCEELDASEIEDCSRTYLEEFVEKTVDSLAQHQIVAVGGVDKVHFWINIDPEGKVSRVTYRSRSNEKTANDLFAAMKELPAFEPGEIDGEPYGVRFIIDYIPIKER